MAKKVIIKESMVNRLIAESVISESTSDIITNADFKKAVVDAIKNNKDVEKTIEKEVKKIIAKTLPEVFRVLWQRKDFYQGMV